MVAAVGGVGPVRMTPGADFKFKMRCLPAEVERWESEQVVVPAVHGVDL
jgi:hypothetical protein